MAGQPLPAWDQAAEEDRLRARAMIAKLFDMTAGEASAEQIGDEWLSEMLGALQATRRDAITRCAAYVRHCGTASHPNGYGDWCGGEVDPIKLLTGVAKSLDNMAKEYPKEPGGA